MLKYLVIGIVLMVIITIIIVVVILTRKKKSSGSSICSSQNPTGTCPNGQVCQNGKCVCVSNCNGKSCGDDGCGGSCGECPNGSTCQNGVCVAPTGQGFTCTTTGCQQDCTLEKYEDDPPTCYTSEQSCQMSCTEAPCSSQYPNGTCPRGSACRGGVCTVPQNCPYPNSNLPEPSGVPDGTYSISCNGIDLVGINQVMLFSMFPVKTTWTYNDNILSMNETTVNGVDVQACQLQARDECYETNCGNPSGSVHPSTTPSGIVFCLPNVEPNSPQHFVLGNDFIYSIDAKAYLVPDSRPGVLLPCIQGTSPGVINITYTIDESKAHVWVVSPS